MENGFGWQEDLKGLCEYVARKVWFNNCANLPEKIIAFVHKYKNYGRYSNFRKKRIIKKLIYTISDYLKINSKYINLEVGKYSERFIGCLGFFRPNSEIGADIYISYSSEFTIYRQSAIIVHELTHYFAYLNEIFFETESEKCTDILAIFLGFYPILCDGYSEETYSSKVMFGNKKSMVAGYLSDCELGYCQAVISSMGR